MEQRIRKLEETVSQQSFLLLILMVILIIDTAALLILWGTAGTPNFDHIAVSLTVFQTLFGVAALYGFWALRGLTREKAEEVAEAEVRKMAPPLIRREVQEHLQAIGFDPISDEDLRSLVDATGNTGMEGENGK